MTSFHGFAVSHVGSGLSLVSVEARYSSSKVGASLILVLTGATIMVMLLLTGKRLDQRLTVRQIVGLRFASDEDFAALAAWAVRQNPSEDAIKKAVTTWQPDTYRA